MIANLERQAAGFFQGENITMVKKKRVKTNGVTEEHTAAIKTTVLASEPESSPEFMAAAVSVQERIALLAYNYWEQRGRVGGSPEEDWFRAEREILSQMNALE
jgi:hypothetical protein